MPRVRERPPSNERDQLIMPPYQALKLLLDSISSHKIALTEDDVGWAFNAKNTQDDVTNWVQQYLGKETLLSREEAEL